MSRHERKKASVIVLAKLHRYFLILTFLPIFFIKETGFLIMGICWIFYGLYSFIGYKLQWRHIGCSCQATHHQEMTPDHISWGNIKKSEVYGNLIMDIVFGCLFICLSICLI